MSFTVQQMLEDAMGLIGVIAMDEPPTTSELNNALRVANVMLDTWSAQRLMLRADSSIDFTMTTTKASYTAGASGCDITTSKILRVNSSYVTDSNIDYPLEIVTKELYDSLQDKDVSTGRPMYVAYDPGIAQQSVQKGTLYFYFTPDKNYPVHMEVSLYLTELVNLADTVTLEPMYYEAFQYNLAERLFRRYHDSKVPIPQDITRIAHQSISYLKTMNSSPVKAAMDIPGAVAKYNIYTDEGN